MSAEPKEVANLAAAVRRVNLQYPGDHDTAATALEKIIRRSPAFREAAIPIAARYLVRKDNFSIRSKGPETPGALDTPGAPEMPVTQALASGDRQREMMQIVSDRWYDWPLPFSLGRAGDLTRRKCRLIIERYFAQEAGLRANRKVFEELGKQLPEGKRAEEVMSSVALARYLRRLK